MSNRPSRISVREIKQAIKAVQDTGLSIRQVSFDEKGLPVVEIGENPDSTKKELEGAGEGYL